MRTNDYNKDVSELIDGVPTAKNQDGQTLEELEKEFEEKDSAFVGHPLC